MGEQMMLTKFNTSAPGGITKYSVDSINNISNN